VVAVASAAVLLGESIASIQVLGGLAVAIGLYLTARTAGSGSPERSRGRRLVRTRRSLVAASGVKGR
jgi:drug/metabolite transporter (DMT)-like permease